MAKDNQMEFKFSCKWFEINFSGDPGYVERSIEKYEPFVLMVLKKIESEIQNQEITQRNDYHQKPKFDKKYDRQSSRWDRRDHNQKKDNYHSNQNRERRENGGQPSEGGVEEEEVSPYSPNPSTLHADSEVRKEPEKTKPEHAEPVAKPADVKPADKPERSEFAPRRKIPRIRAEELNRVMDHSRPRTHHDRVMVFGHYMETRGGGTDFTIAEIKRCYRAVNQDPGNNIDQVINHATRSGFILRGEQGRTTRFKLSGKGKRYVEDGLKLT